MPDVRTVAATAALAAITACASNPASGPEPTQAAADSGAAATRSTSAPFRPQLLLDVDGALPALAAGAPENDAIFSSRVDLGLDDDLLRYRATYRLEAGDVFPFAGDPDKLRPPTTVAGQRFGQDVILNLPTLAGAPVSLGVTTEVRDVWQLAGEAQVESEQARLEWSPWRATVSVRWAEGALDSEPALALRCELESSLGLPLAETTEHSRELRVSGRACVVADGTPSAGLPVRTWKVGYVWSGAGRESVARVRVIEPEWASGLSDLRTDPAYQLGLGHRRDFGTFSAEAHVALQQPPMLTGVEGEAFGAGTRWSADASLTWHLPDLSLSASWAQGVDPLWFVPQESESRDRFGLALDLSPWVRSVAPGSSPALGLSWEWSRLHLPGEAPVNARALSLDVALPF